MSWREYVQRCQAHDPCNYSLLYVSARPAGRLPRSLAPRLEGVSRDLLGRQGDSWWLPARGRDEASEALGALARRLADAGLIPPLSGEVYAVRALDTGRRLGVIDRSAATCLGLRTRGVHLNGTTVAADGTLRMWLARRSSTCSTFPGKLDNLAAGGVAAGASLRTALRQEAFAEAGLAQPDIDAARLASRLVYRADTEAGLVDVEMFVFDLDLSPSFAPRNQDGSVDRFLLVPLDEAEHLALAEGAFKSNCGFVLFDYLVRHGRAAPVPTSARSLP